MVSLVQRRPSFAWQLKEMERIGRVLKSVTEALDASSIPYAVVGGNAVAAWVATRDIGLVRATKDVDLLLRRSDLDRAERALSEIGWIRGEVWGVHVFMEAADPLPSLGVHVVLAEEKVRASSIYAAPDVTSAVRTVEGFLVVSLPELVRMKLEANRRMDQVHLEDLFRVGLIDSNLAARLPEDLRDRLRHVRDTMEWFTTPPGF